MVPKFLNLDNLSWPEMATCIVERWKERYGLSFCSWEQSCAEKSYMSIFVFFCHICSTTDCWDPEILLPWYLGVATSPLCCVNSCPPKPLVSFDHVINKTSSPSFHYLYCNTVYISNQWCFLSRLQGNTPYSLASKNWRNFSNIAVSDVFTLFDCFFFF